LTAFKKAISVFTQMQSLPNDPNRRSLVDEKVLQEIRELPSSTPGSPPPNNPKQGKLILPGPGKPLPSASASPSNNNPNKGSLFLPPWYQSPAPASPPKNPNQGNMIDEKRDSMIGKTLGMFRIVEQIGAGSATTVFKAYHTFLDHYVAIKVLPDYAAHDPVFRERFLREARSVSRLDHPNIVQVYQFGEEENFLYNVSSG
jgi:protein kinase-like protein